MFRPILAAALLSTVAPAALAQSYAPPGYAPAYPPGYTVSPQPTYPPPAYAEVAPNYAPPAYSAAPQAEISVAPPLYDGGNDGARPGNVIGTGSSLPFSSRASNIDAYDTRSEIAPRLPTPAVGDDNSPRAFLLAARGALETRRTGEAQEALERAESRMLTRSVAPANADAPDYNPIIHDVGSARRALAAGDYADATRLIDRVLTVVR